MIRKSPHQNNLLVSTVLVLAVSYGSARADYQSTVLSQAPVGYWRLNETTPPPPPPILATNSGSVGSAGNGTYTNSAIRGVTPGAIVSEPSNAAVGFTGISGSGNRVRIPFQPQWNQTNQLTVEFWAKPGQTNALDCPAASVEFIPSPAQRNGWLFYQGDPGNLNGDGNGFMFRHYNESGLTSITVAGVRMQLATNQWFHVVGVLNGTNLSIYVNGVLGNTTNFVAPPRGNTNSAIPLTFGARADGVSGFFEYSGLIDEAAVYDVALTPARILAHYQAGTNAAPTTPYSQVVLADAPAGYWRFNEPSDPPAANIGTLGTVANAKYIYNAAPGGPGPRPPVYPGFEAANKSVSFDGVGGGYVIVPALNLNTNTVTITGWINASGSQLPDTGIIFNRGGTTVAGLTIDVGGGLALSYNWNDDPATFNWFSGVSLLDSDWTYVALVIQPSQANLYAAFNTNTASWIGGTNFANHVVQAFEGPTLFGADYGPTTNLFFKGAIDEVAIYNRSLSEGEAYTAYSSAVGGVAPRVFTDVAVPANTPYVGDTLNLTVDAGGTPNLGYVWRKGGTPIHGATSSTFTITNLASTDSGNYDVVITNAFGQATSGPVPITIQTPTVPVITQGPTGRTLYLGGTLDLKVLATGGQLHYQWQKAGTNISGATTSAYLVNSVSGSDAGSYTITVTNSLGSAPAGPVTVNVIVPGTNTYEGLIVADGPEAWWRLDEAPGSTAMLDAMGRHDGTYVGTGVTLGVSGALSKDGNTAVSFDGSDSFGDVPYSPALNTSEFTIEVWAFLTDNSAQRSPVSTYDTTAHKGIFFKSNTDGTWESDVGLNDNFIYYLALLGTVPNGKWTHIVANFNNNVGQINYLNGKLSQGNIEVAGGGGFQDFVRNGKSDFLIGGVGTNWQGIARWKGSIDEVAVYTKALTADQVLNHYAQGLYGNTTKPIFISQPSPTAVAVSDPASLSAQVEGSLPITYQWFKDGVPLLSTTSFSATNDTLTFATTTSANTGNYQLVATNPAGTNASTVVALTIFPPVQFANATNGLVLHLKFDGDLTDSSGRGNNGTAVGAPSFVAGQVGQALHYSTKTDTGGSGGTVTNANYVTLGHPSDLLFGATTSFSVAFWVRLPTNYLGGDLPFFGSAVNSANNQGFTFCPSYQLGGWQWDIMQIAGGVTNNIDVTGPDGSINNGRWHHFAATFDRQAAVALTYLDGSQVKTTSIGTIGAFDSTNSISIGQDPTGAYPESGSADLDDLAVWHRALTPVEVYQIWYSGLHFGNALDKYGPVSAAISISGTTATVVWQAGTLYQSDSPLGPWTAVPGATPPTFTVTPGTGAKFYRIHL